MRIEVFQGFELVDMIYDYVSITNKRRYQDAGEFTVTLNSLGHSDVMRAGNYIVLNDEGMVIENYHKFDNLTQGITVEVTGRTLSSILDRRCEAATTFNISQTVETQIYNLVNRNFINPSNPNRKISNMVNAPSKGLQTKLSEVFEFENENCLEMIKTLCVDAGLGFRINYLPEQEQFEFEVYHGSDVSEEVFFSQEFGNISDADIYTQTKDYKNVGYRNKDSVLTEVNGEISGLERREIMVSSNELGDVINRLNELKSLTSAECTVLLTDQFIYKEDWNVGDTVTFLDKELGFIVEQPILEVVENYTDKMDVDVNFGDKIPTVFEKFERK